MSYPLRRLVFRPEDLSAATQHPFGCFELKPHDIIQRACTGFARVKDIQPFRIFLQPYVKSDDCFISREGSTSLALPKRSMVFSAGSLMYYRGWELAGNFAHEYGHDLAVNPDDEFEADFIASQLIGPYNMLSWLTSMGERHGFYTNGDHPSFNRRIQHLQEHTL
ncbi:MAG: hypothetical protein WAZ18_02840 [Alphaproteobacteria bacterium]